MLYLQKYSLKIGGTMKMFLLLLTVAMFASCSQISDTKVDSAIVANTISVDIPQSQTRTALGERDGEGNYSVYWSAEDMLVANGSPSTSISIKNGGRSAQFTYGVIDAPFKLTYPYTEGSLCAEDRPTVVFAAEQNYKEGTFGVGYAPMCGYNTGLGTSVLKHLAGVLRISLIGSTTLSKIEIIAEEGVALAGEFDVNCQTGDITPIEGVTVNKVTYLANQELSNEAKSFFVVVPAGNLGVCKILLIDNQGLCMKLNWNGQNVKAGIVREFDPFAFKGGVSLELGGLSSEQDEFEIPGFVAQKSNEIWYTTTDGAVVTPTIGPADISGFGANIVSNTYENGKGVITFDGDVTLIGQNTFTFCDNLESITIPEKVTAIKYAAFYECENLTSVTFPDGITDIEYRIFQGCPKLSAFYGGVASSDHRCVVVNGVVEGFAPAGLTEYTIPDGVTSIDNYVFGYCSELESVTVPDSVTSFGYGPFAGCSSLSAFYGRLASSDNRYLAIDNKLVAFASAGLTEYVIPDGITEIGYGAFDECSNLTSVTIPDSVTSLNDDAFYKCRSLTNITLGKGVATIGNDAFAYCYALPSITIPESVTMIKDGAFAYCTSLTEVYCKSTTPPTIGYTIFIEPNSDLVIYVPMSNDSSIINAYKSAANWSRYQDRIQEDVESLAIDGMKGETEEEELEF